MIAWLALGASAADLVVDGATVELSGSVTYDAVVVRNGGRITVAPWDGADGGALELVADVISVDASSSIEAVGAGWRGVAGADGEGPDPGGAGVVSGGGGGGGAGGTPGWGVGCGLDGSGGPGAAVPGPGSGGGGVPIGPGGAGGGHVRLLADRIDLLGVVDASGADASGGGGGGGGGSIELRGNVVTCGGWLVARGGDGGGGGGGGRVVVSGDERGQNCDVDTRGGASACACPAPAGPVLAGRADYDGDGVSFADGDCAPTDPAVRPGASDADCDGQDDDCDGLSDEDASTCGGWAAASYRGHTYVFAEDRVDWSTALAACRALGPAFDLVSIDDADENAFLASEIAAYLDTYESWWIGLSDAALEGRFVWSNGSPATFAAWSDSFTQPNDAGSGEDCALLGFEDIDEWRDAACGGNYPSVCESCTLARFWPDGDGDGWGDAGGAPTEACAAPPGHAARSGDCDDADALVHPGAYEVCNGVDDDCDGSVDDDAGAALWFEDGDGDGAGDPARWSLGPCASPPAGAVADGRDCDDGDPAANSGAPEDCNGRDDDCDGQIDEDGACPNCVHATDGVQTWQLCTDERSWSLSGDACRSVGYDLVTIDDMDENYAVENLRLDAGVLRSAWIGLNDRDAEGVFEWVGAPGSGFEWWDAGEPNDGVIEEGNQDCVVVRHGRGGRWDDQGCGSAWPLVCEVHCALLPQHLDADGDGFGDPAAPVDACAATPGVVPNDDDCDDADPRVHPGAPERLADGVDQDCDGLERCFSDVDLDGFGAPTEVLAPSCSARGAAPAAGDCDDGDASIHPGAPELPADGIDQDCDCGDTCFLDADGDGVIAHGDLECGETALDRDEALAGYLPCGCRTAGAAPAWLALGALLAAVSRRQGVVLAERLRHRQGDDGRSPAASPPRPS